MAKPKPILCLDFDGVIHSYVSPWDGATTIPDDPVPGALDFIYDALDHYRIAIYSSRSGYPGGIKAMQTWLFDHAHRALEETPFAGDLSCLRWLDRIEWPTTKPPAFLTLDDRAMQFEGVFPKPTDLLDFKPWNK